MKKLLTIFGLVAVLTACAAEQAPPPAPVNKALPPKIGLDVQVINLADRSGLQPVSSPYNSNHFSPTIADAIKQWAGDRLQAGGQAGQAIIVVKDASLIEQPLPIKEGMDGWFTRQQGSKYIARAEVSIEANGREGFAMADAVATRSVTLPENPSAIEKQDSYFTLLNDLMKDLGQNLETGIQMHMGAFIIAPQNYGAATSPAGMNATMAGGDDITPVIIQAPGGQQGPAQMAGASQNVPLGAQMQAQMQAAQMQAAQTQSAVAAATVPQPPSLTAGPQTMVVSQSPLMPTADINTMSNSSGVMQAPLAAPAQPSHPLQAPVFGTTAVPTIPDHTSVPVSSPPQLVAAPAANVSYDPYSVYPAPPMPQQIPPGAYNAASAASMPQPAPIPASSYTSYVAGANQPSTGSVTIPLSASTYAQ